MPNEPKSTPSPLKTDSLPFSMHYYQNMDSISPIKIRRRFSALNLVFESVVGIQYLFLEANIDRFHPVPFGHFPRVEKDMIRCNNQ